VTTIDVELMHGWMRADAPACCVALAKLGAKERAAALVQCEPGDLALLLRHAPVWWLNVVQTELPDLPWNEAIVEAGVDINVIRMLRGARREVREHRLASFPERQRARIARALVLPRDRVLSALDDRPPIAHLSETAGTVMGRISSLHAQGESWIYLVNDVEGYAGQVAIVDAARAADSQLMADLPLVQRPVLRSVLLLDHAMRLPDWQVHDSLPVVDEAERFAGVLRLGDLVRALRLTDADANPRPINLPVLIIGSWTDLLVALMGRRRTRS
jgi:CBS domain-containing protein